MSEIPNADKILDAYLNLKIDPKTYNSDKLPEVVVDNIKYFCGNIELITNIINTEIHVQISPLFLEI